MTIYFSWANEEDVFNVKKHSSVDIKIVKLIIQQKEGEICSAQIWTPDFSLPVDGRQFVYISAEMNGEISPLFKGRLKGIPIQADDYLKIIEFTAEPTNSNERIKNFIQSEKGLPKPHALCFSNEEELKPSDYLESINKLFYWDRVSHGVSLMDYFEGKKEINVDKNIFASSLKMKLSHLPFDSIRCQVHADWLQEGEGEVNIGTEISKGLDSKIISTLTPKIMMKMWPREGMKIGRAGYQILKSELEEIDISENSKLGIRSDFTKSLEFVKDGEKSKVRFKIGFLRPLLNIYWSYKQKRHEIAEFNLFGRHQLAGRNKSQEKKLNILLYGIDEIPDQNLKGSFFETELGKSVLVEACQRAKAHLLASFRCVEFEFKVPFGIFKEIDLDTTVCLAHPQFPEQLIRGKIIDYQVFCEFDQRYISVRMASSIGEGEEGKVDLKLGHKEALEGELDLASLSAKDFVSELSFKNLAHQQYEQLLLQENLDEEVASEILKKYQTSFYLRLKDLRTTYKKKRHFYYNSEGTISCPQQIDIQQLNRD